jgi:hypothetical protein
VAGRHDERRVAGGFGVGAGLELKQELELVGLDGGR